MTITWREVNDKVIASIRRGKLMAVLYRLGIKSAGWESKL